MITYKSSGVDSAAGDNLINKIKNFSISKTNVLSDIGGFAGLFKLPKINNPVLVSGTDGVGTKLKLAFKTNIHNTVGIDLVAMCINDIITNGATPLFFLDYFACSKLNVDVTESVISGIVEGCRQASCALLGGETAELPGMYHESEYDLAGFAVGIVDQSKIIDGSKVQEGDSIIGLPSTGLHSNGFSLARKVLFEYCHFDLDEALELLQGKTIADALLCPTKIYNDCVQKVIKEINIKAMCHVTGGGIPGNLPRIFPDNFVAFLNDNWLKSDIQKLIERTKLVDISEIRNVFNDGIGFIFICSKESEESVLSLLRESGEKPIVIGEMKRNNYALDFENRVIYNVSNDSKG